MSGYSLDRVAFVPHSIGRAPARYAKRLRTFARLTGQLSDIEGARLRDYAPAR